MFKRLLLLFCFLCLNCSSFWRSLYPTNHNQDRYGVVTVKIDSDWREPQRTWIREAIAEMASRFGPTVRIVESGNADLAIYESQSANCRDGAGSYDLGTRYVLINPICTFGNSTIFKAAVVHEIGHYLGLMHICFEGQRDQYCISPSRGKAIMNPTVDNYSYGITDLDIREFLRVCGDQKSILCNYRRMQESSLHLRGI